MFNSQFNFARILGSQNFSRNKNQQTLPLSLLFVIDLGEVHLTHQSPLISKIDLNSALIFLTNDWNLSFWKG